VAFHIAQLIPCLQTAKCKCISPFFFLWSRSVRRLDRYRTRLKRFTTLAVSSLRTQPLRSFVAVIISRALMISLTIQGLEGRVSRIIAVVKNFSAYQLGKTTRPFHISNITSAHLPCVPDKNSPNFINNNQKQN